MVLSLAGGVAEVKILFALLALVAFLRVLSISASEGSRVAKEQLDQLLCCLIA
jgi:hypothetical protein